MNAHKAKEVMEHMVVPAILALSWAVVGLMAGAFGLDPIF
jgi:hypothetical protein